MSREFNYQIQIGKMTDISVINNPKEIPKTIISINQDQVDIIHSLADVEHSEDAEPIYVINKLRFKIAFVYRESTAPPLGLMPLKVHNEMRLQEIYGAINRYKAAKMVIPDEWIAEQESLEAYFQEP